MNKITPRTLLTRTLLAILLCASCLLSACATTKIDKKTLEKSQYHYQLGANYFSERLIPQAIKELLESVKHNPENPDAHHLLGFIYMGRHDNNKAIQHFRKAVAAREDFFICQNNLGAAYMADERWDEAAEVFSELVNKPTYNTPELAYNNLGWSRFKQGQHIQAQEALQMAIFLKPEMCKAHNNLGLVQLDRKNKMGALRNFKKAIQLCPTFAEPHFHTAQILRQRNDETARDYYSRCYDIAQEGFWGERCRSYLEVY